MLNVSPMPWHYPSRGPNWVDLGIYFLLRKPPVPLFVGICQRRFSRPPTRKSPDGNTRTITYSHSRQYRAVPLAKSAGQKPCR